MPFYRPSDLYRTYLWLMTSDGSARNQVNAVAARVPERAPVIPSSRAVTFGDLDVNAPFYLLWDTSRNKAWTKVSDRALRNPANREVRPMNGTFLVLL